MQNDSRTTKDCKGTGVCSGLGMANGSHKKHTSLIDRKFGKLTVKSFVEIKNHKSYWLCECECGNTKIIRRDHLTRGKTISCGCYGESIRGRNNVTHGKSRERIYRIWKNMRRRCDSPCVAEYMNYGGRGISVCDEWQTFEPFYEWSMAHGYSDELSIDRIDNDGNYGPTNCRWATAKEQANNRRPKRISL